MNIRIELSTVLRLLAGLAVAAVVTAACGDDDESPTEGSEALVTAIRIEDGVNVRIGSATGLTSVSDPVPVDSDVDVRTDGSGFAEIKYFDGSLTRLDVNTELEVLGLVDGPTGSVIRTKMGVGRTWHRVQAPTDNDLYEVETSSGTAVARGTAFIVECRADGCVFTVLEGTVELLLSDGTMAETNNVFVEAGQSVQASLDNQVEPTAAISTSPFTDSWLSRNNDRDHAAGMEDLAAGFATP